MLFPCQPIELLHSDYLQDLYHQQNNFLRIFVVDPCHVTKPFMASNVPVSKK